MGIIGRSTSFRGSDNRLRMLRAETTLKIMIPGCATAGVVGAVDTPQHCIDSNARRIRMSGNYRGSVVE
jgi:hypothetical protein